MTTRIVVGIDGSDHARRALAFALEEADRRGDAVVEAVMAYPSLLGYPAIEYGDVGPPREWFEQTTRERLAAEVATVGDGDHATVEQRIAEGSPGLVLVEASGDADLVVVGTRGRGGFRSLVLGSTSHQVVSHAHCPVVVVPAPRADEDAGDA